MPILKHEDFFDYKQSWKSIFEKNLMWKNVRCENSMQKKFWSQKTFGYE